MTSRFVKARLNWWRWFSRVFNQLSWNLAGMYIQVRKENLDGKKINILLRCHGNGGHFGFLLLTLHACFLENRLTYKYQTCFNLFILYVSWICQRGFSICMFIHAERCSNFHKLRFFGFVFEKMSRYQSYGLFIQILLWQIVEPCMSNNPTKFQINRMYRCWEIERASLSHDRNQNSQKITFKNCA